MTKGTTAAGERRKRTHTLCNRCGKRSYHMQHKRCASCGFPGKKMRKFGWSAKSQRRRTVGTGRCAHLKEVARRAKNGFRDGKTPAPRKTSKTSA